jgi:hypothetical protein
MGNPFVYVELYTPDLAKAKKFYSSLLDWKMNDMKMPDDYTMLDVGGGTGGGMMKAPAGLPSQWLPYIGVDDVAAATKKAEGLGAKIHKTKTEVSGFGWFSIISDPTGAMVALWQAKK